ncbi:MAG: 3'-5' exonuclease [Thalassobaculum sp.]|uniref:3'-5' exonuclease n=1 Tax=Thalassobaculum sp. TaxID=2022740 RepID=UPI0032ED1907
MSDPQDSEALARRLECHLDYRVLRRVKTRDVFADPVGDTKIGVLLDTETTGLDRREDKVIELAMIAFEFDDRGQVCQVRDRFQGFNDPGRPIPADVVELTGITDALVRDRIIDRDAVARLVGPAVVVIAHNAGFDRRFAERLHPVFSTKAWACSLAEVPWIEAGIASAKLDYLAMRYGLFHDGHRGLADCEVLLEILSRPLPGSTDPTLKRLLDTARQPTWRVWALESPFDMKDRLKARGYRWSDGSDGNPRAWYRDVVDAALEAEKQYLTTEIYPHLYIPRCVRVTAFDRFSERV